MKDERIIRLADPYVFRVSDTYHQLYIDYFYNSEYFYNNYVNTDSSVMSDGDDDTGSEDSDDMETDWAHFSPLFSFCSKWKKHGWVLE